MLKPRKKYNMVPPPPSPPPNSQDSSTLPSSPSTYANPAFRDSLSNSFTHDSYSSSSIPLVARTDPLPQTSRFESLPSTGLPEEPRIPGPPTTTSYNTPNIAQVMEGSSNRHDNNESTPRIDVTMSSTPPQVSPVSPTLSARRFSSRTSFSSSRRSTSNPTSPTAAVTAGIEKKPSRFQSDFSHLKRGSWQKASPPDPAFRSHRRNFSEEAGRYRQSAFTEDVVEEEESSVSGDNGTRNAGAGVVREEIVHTPTPPGNGLGLRYVSADEGNEGKKGGSSRYSNIPDDDDSDGVGEVAAKQKRPKADWLSITILLLSIYSTIGSIFFFVIAVIRPRYGNRVSAGGFKPQDAQLVSAIIAKTIELSFVSVFVSFLGQVLSRRALMTGSKGVNIAELSMRSWVTQPGTLLTHSSSVKFAGLTFLGALSLTATVFASFYTTAADTLVSPKLAWGSPQNRNLTGIAYTSYANSTYRLVTCKTAISDEQDPVGQGYLIPVSRATCGGILSAGRGYRDLSDWSELWAESSGQTFPNPRKRPAAPSSLDLVNYAGSWMRVSGENGINRATLAMPHPGVISSTRNSSLNGILQPEEIGSGYGSFIVKASVPNPVVDVTCAPVDADSVQWYMERPGNRRTGNPDPVIQQLFNFTDNATYFFDPAVQQFIVTPYAAPRFPAIPIEYNSVTWDRPGDPSVYILTKSSETGGRQGGYTLCGMKSFTTPNCSSEFQAFESGGNATVNCDLNNPLAFKEELARNGVATVEKPIKGKEAVRDLDQPDFRDVAGNVLLAVSLNTGISNGNASITRFLSQMALDTRTTNLDNSKPSLAEALAVLLGNAIITSAVDSVFTTYFPYNVQLTPPPFKEFFTAQVSTIEYTSGAGSGWKPIFYVVLVGVLIMNVFCLIYFSCVREGFVTDWTEVQNLFCIVMDGGAIKNTPQMASMEDVGKRGDEKEEMWKGTGGTGPKGQQYKTGFWFTEKKGRWYVTDWIEKGTTTGYERV